MSYICIYALCDIHMYVHELCMHLCTVSHLLVESSHCQAKFTYKKYEYTYTNMNIYMYIRTSYTYIYIYLYIYIHIYGVSQHTPPYD